MSKQVPAPAAGIYTPTVTFFKPDGYSIDIESQIKHAKYLRDNGIQGLVVFGSTGENAHLTLSERVSVVKALHESVPDITLISGIAQNSLTNALEEIKLVKEAGSAYALVLGSSYYGSGVHQEGIINWFTEIADKSELPVLIYVYPGVTNGLKISLDTVKKLSAHPNIVGTKFSYNDAADYTVIAGDKQIAEHNNFHFFSGLGQLLTTVLLLGGKGVIDGLSNVVPKVYVKIFQLVQEGKISEASALQHEVTKVEVLLGPDLILVLKDAVKQFTGIGEYTLGRIPLNVGYSKEAAEPFFKAFAKLAEIEKSI